MNTLRMLTARHSVSESERDAVLLFLLLLAPALYSSGFPSLDFMSGPPFHVTIELSGALIGLLSGFAFLALFHRLGEWQNLLLGLAFMGSATEDLAHGVLSLVMEEASTPALTAPLERFLPGTYVSGRLIMVVLMISALMVGAKPFSSLKTRQNIFAVVSMVFLGTIFVTALAAIAPLPQSMYPEKLIAWPVDLLIGFGFAYVLAAYLRSYISRGDGMVWWLCLSIGFSMTGQFIMSFSRELHSPLFNLAHICKVLGYAAPLAGLSIWQGQLIETSWTIGKKLKHFRELLDQSSDIILVSDSDGLILDFNQTAVTGLGYTSEELTGMSMDKLLPDTHEDPWARHLRAIRNNEVQLLETTFRDKAGTEFPVEISVRSINHGDSSTHLTIARDTYVRKAAEAALRAANRALKVISEASQILVRAESEQELLDDICHEIVAHGDYALAWVGYAQDDPEKTMRVMASFGCTEYLKDIDVRWDESDLGSGPTGKAIRYGIPQVVCNTGSDPSYTPWSPKAKECGFQSSIALPLISNSTVIGAVNIYSASQDAFFGKDERILMMGLADDLAYGIVALRERERCREAEKEILRLNEDLERKVKERTGELRQTLNDVQSARDRIDGILKSVADGIIVTDIYNNVVLMNRAAEDLLDVRLSEILGQPIDFVIKAATLREKLMKSIRQNKTSYKFDFMLPDREDRHMNAQTSVIFDKDGRYTGLVTVIRDVTYEREVDRMKTEFISTAAHELRTPLTSIRGFSEILLTRGGLTEAERAEFLSYINKQSLNLAAIINDLLDISRIEAKKGLAFNKVDFKPCESLGNIMSYYQKSSPGHTFELAMPEEDVMIHADPAKLQQVMENLLGNAVKYSPEGGTIRIQASRKGDDLHVCVRDEGIGMTAEQVGRVFEKFYRADTSNLAVEGTGLGMTIVKYIVEAHGGSIHVESELGTGTAVHFLIPLGKQTSPEGGIPGEC
jgi:PAS domain S-box-containing protein